MKVILDILGKQTEEDLSFIADTEAISYANKINSKQPRINLKKEFPCTHRNLTQILEEMIQFNPHFRKQASQLLEDPIFDACREQFDDYENLAPFKIELVTDGKGHFDYNNYTSNKLDIS